MKIEFPADNKRLGVVLYALAQAPIQPEFEINYTIKDTERAKNELLGKAIADSKRKAKVLTEAAEVSLGDIILIAYSWGEIGFTSRPMPRAMLLEDCDYYEDECYDMDIKNTN